MNKLELLKKYRQVKDTYKGSVLDFIREQEGKNQQEVETPQQQTQPEPVNTVNQEEDYRSFINSYIRNIRDRILASGFKDE